MTHTSELLDIPEDVWNGVDGDNTIHGYEPTGFELTQLQNWENTHQVNAAMRAPLGVAQVAQAVYVPFRRQLKRGSRGNDVFAVRRALSKAGFGDWGDWGKMPRTMGIYMVRNLKLFQKHVGLAQDGVYGLRTHTKLMPFFDSYGAYLMKSWHPIVIDREKAKRDSIVAAAFFGYHNRGSIHYTQSTWRMYGVRNHIHPPFIPRYEDCSSFATWCYWLAGAPDPNGLGYNGQGYTGTQVNHGKNITLSQAQPGDLIFYGWSRGIPTHVALYVGLGMIVSHGSEIGPLYINARYRNITTIRSYL